MAFHPTSVPRFLRLHPGPPPSPSVAHMLLLARSLTHARNAHTHLRRPFRHKVVSKTVFVIGGTVPAGGSKAQVWAWRLQAFQWFWPTASP